MSEQNYIAEAKKTIETLLTEEFKSEVKLISLPFNYATDFEPNYSIEIDGKPIKNVFIGYTILEFNLFSDKQLFKEMFIDRINNELK